MNTFQLNKVSFTYPGQERAALKDLDLTIAQGEFLTLCGTSGCGKTTLLRQLKTNLSLHGMRYGQILFEGVPLEDVGQRTQAEKIGFVFQNPENQLVTDKVWHELAFGLESLGHTTPEIRLRVAEMASFFGIQSWFYKNVSELSGGQKQLLNLAAVMTLQPSVLILDEPTAQLDPIAATDFLAVLGRINRELGTTVLLTEHRLEDAFPLSDRVIVMDRGEVCCDGTPKEVGTALAGRLRSGGRSKANIESNTNAGARDQLHLGVHGHLHKHPMFYALPTPMRVFASVPNGLDCPVTVRDGRAWLDELIRQTQRNRNDRKTCENNKDARPDHGKKVKAAGVMEHSRIRADRKSGSNDKKPGSSLEAVVLKDVWFQYERNGADVIKSLCLSVPKGEFLAILGGNGTGKTTALSLITGLNTPYRGNVTVRGRCAALPQNPQCIFVKKTVEEDLKEMLRGKEKFSLDEKQRRVKDIAALCRLDELMKRHPYDLSGGEQQRAALAKVLLLEPEILILDEPTKGLDGAFKRELAFLLKRLEARGVTVIMVSHDIEFCAEYAHRCALFFDGNIVSEGLPGTFFSGNSFYTTAANRMARHVFESAITAEDIITACGGDSTAERLGPDNESCSDAEEGCYPSNQENFEPEVNRHSRSQDTYGSRDGLSDDSSQAQTERTKNKKNKYRQEQASLGHRSLTARTKTAAFMILAAIPLTLFVGIYYMGDRKYYFISTLILLEALLPFAMVFESRKPQARELIILAVLCGIAVAGRAAFFWAPQFKPVTAVVMITAVAFGGEAGFLVGAMTALVSNMFFGQGPWTPWQMFAFGIIGFITGVLFQKGLLRSNRYALAIFGGFSAFFIYGGLMNPAAVLMFQSHPTREMFLLAYFQGIPFDLIHAAATVIFLLAAAEPMLEKLERIKLKYGLIMEGTAVNGTAASAVVARNEKSEYER